MEIGVAGLLIGVFAIMFGIVALMWQINHQSSRLETKIETQGKELREEIKEQGNKTEAQGKHLEAKIESQGKELRDEIKEQGTRVSQSELDQARLNGVNSVLLRHTHTHETLRDDD